MSRVIRPIVAGIIGFALGAGALFAAYSRDPGLTFEMDGPTPAFFSGVHNPEHDGPMSFAWTTDRVTIDLIDLHRSSPWACSVRFRGPRPEGLAPPLFEIAVDGARVASVTAASEFHDLGFSIPAGRASTNLVMSVTPAFTPGLADKRILGVQLDRFQCRPSGSARPPGWPMMQAAFASAFVGGMFVLLGLPLAGGILASVIVALGAAVMLTTGGAVYGHYSNTIANLTVWITLLTFVFMSFAEKVASRRFPPAARAVFAISAVALMLKLFGLLHPSKPIVDALFNAHRLNDVIGGKYFFTQPFVGGVEMPYAIGLYVFAWPWAWLVADHVALIRTVAATADVLAGALLYPVLVRAWGDRKSAALAVLFYQLAPLGYSVLGNANLTNLFGQSVALTVMAAAITWNLSLRRIVSLLAFTALVAWALCSHVSTVATLLATLGLLVLLYWWRGDPSRRGAALTIVAASAAALAVSWFIYYNEFTDEISAAFGRMFYGGTAESAATAAEAARGYMGTGDRFRDLMSQAVSSVGWPMVILAAIGAWFVWRKGVRDRLVSALLAWTGVWVVFSASTVFSRVEPEFVRYTIEFLGRINLATIPLVAILAARGVAAGWDDGTPAGIRTALRALTIALIVWSWWIAWSSLIGWFNR